MSTNNDTNDKTDGRENSNLNQLGEFQYRTRRGVGQVFSPLLGEAPIDTIHDDPVFEVEIFPEVGGRVPLGVWFKSDGEEEESISLRPTLTPEQARELGKQLIATADRVEQEADE